MLHLRGLKYPLRTQRGHHGQMQPIPTIFLTDTVLTVPLSFWKPQATFAHCPWAVCFSFYDCSEAAGYHISGQSRLCFFVISLPTTRESLWILVAYTFSCPRLSRVLKWQPRHTHPEILPCKYLFLEDGSIDSGPTSPNVHLYVRLSSM